VDQDEANAPDSKNKIVVQLPPNTTKMPYAVAAAGNRE